MKPLDEFREIFGEIWISNNCYNIIKELCLLGSRFAGSESEKEAQEYMKKYLRDINFQPLEWDFEYQGWERINCTFSILTPKEMNIPAISLVLSPSKEIQAELVHVNGGSKEQIMEMLEKANLKENLILLEKWPF